MLIGRRPQSNGGERLEALFGGGQKRRTSPEEEQLLFLLRAHLLERRPEPLLELRPSRALFGFITNRRVARQCLDVDLLNAVEEKSEVLGVEAVEGISR